jgi:RHS repeat-associated protein
VLHRYDYAPFGENIAAGTNGRSSLYSGVGDGQTIKFTGKERDAESGLDYFGVSSDSMDDALGSSGGRYLSSAQGRFTSPDIPLWDQQAADPRSWNLYSYVRNNPLKFTDPTGRDCIYTNNYNSNGTVTVTNEQGSCSGSGGTYVAGTVDPKSLTTKDGLLNYAFTPYDPNGNYTFSNLQLPDPGLEALQRGAQMAEPGVNLAFEGLKLFGFVVAPPFVAAADCISKGKDCSKGGTALAMIPGGGEEETAGQIIARSRAGKILREFPGEYLGATLKEIQKDAKQGIAAARKALKLLKDTRFQK